MRVLLAAFLLASGHSLPATAQAIAHVRNIGSGSLASGTVINIPVTVTAPAGNTIFVASNCFPQAAVSVTDSRGNSYANENGYSNNGLTTNVQRGYLTVPLLAGDQITVTFAGTVGAGASAHEFTGVANAFKDAGASTGQSGNSFATPFASTTQPNDLLFAYTYHDPGTTVTPGGGFTTLLDANGNLFTAYKIVSATGSYNYSGTLNATSNFLTAEFYAFKGVLVPVGLQRFDAE